MDLQERLDELVRAAEAMGLSVRREPLGGSGGGYCMLRGTPVLFIDTTADLEHRYERTLAGLARRPDIDQHYLSPEVREEIDARRRETR